jgi:hypothetical protein
MKRTYLGTPRVIVTLFALLWSSAVSAQTADAREITKVFTTLEAPLDTFTSARDDGFTLVTMNDVVVNGKIIIPRGAKIVGHVAAVASKGKDAAKSALALSIDRAVTGNQEIPLEAIIAAIAAPKKSESETSMPPAAIASNQSKTSTPRNPVSSGDVTLLLADNDSGAIGFEDLTISWHLSIPPPLTIMATHGKRLRIEAGSQILLRMMPPKTAN